MDTEDLLGLNITLTVSPAIRVEKATPATAPSNEKGRFILYADAALHYTSFSRVLNQLLAGKRLDISEGLFTRHVVVKNISVSGSPSNAILLNVQFTGSFKGTATFSAIPVYHEESASIVLLHLRYDLQTANLLLKGARLLFASRIEKELKKITRFPVKQLLDQMQKGITESLNKEWNKGVRGSGDVKNLRLLSVEALQEHLLIRVSCEGYLQITIAEMLLNFKR